ncbi:ABC transporter permease [Bacillaceae bacterium IKA-2]|nr:ABC transporter permease [Bacillaceae bacterium IKA-2]
MNFIKRALLSVKARKGKSVLQIFIFTVIFVLVLSGLAIQSAANKSADMARQSLGSNVTVQADMQKIIEQVGAVEGGGGRGRQRKPVPVDTVEELLTYPEVIGYNFFASATGIAIGFEPIEDESSEEVDDAEESIKEENTGRGGSPMGDISLEGVVFSDAAQEFMDAVSTIVEGRHLTEEDINQNLTIIEQSLAEENALTVGDTITIQSLDEIESLFDLEIVGIYQTTAIGNDFGMSLSALNPVNKLYVPYKLANGLKGEAFIGTIDRAVFHIDDPVNIDNFIDRANAESSIDFTVFSLDTNDRLYQQMIGPINNVASFSENVVYLVTMAGAIILGLIVMMSIRERKYEIGVLLALGEKKSKLIGQFLVEIVVVAIIALGLASVTGNMVASQVGDQLLNQQLQVEETSSTPESFGSVRGAGMGRGNIATQQVEPIDELLVQITTEDLGMLAVIGLFIALLSALLPSLSILRLHPKTILTKQD